MTQKLQKKFLIVALASVLLLQVATYDMAFAEDHEQKDKSEKKSDSDKKSEKKEPSSSVSITDKVKEVCKSLFDAFCSKFGGGFKPIKVKECVDSVADSSEGIRASYDLNAGVLEEFKEIRETVRPDQEYRGKWFWNWLAGCFDVEEAETSNTQPETEDDSEELDDEEYEEEYED